MTTRTIDSYRVDRPLINAVTGAVTFTTAHRRPALTGPVNVDLLQRTMRHIEAHPETHDQSVYFGEKVFSCGTSGCFAGWAVQLAGHKVEYPDGWSRFSLSSDMTIDGVPRWDLSVGELAAHELGLDEVQAEELFNGNNTIFDLRRIVDKYCLQAYADSPYTVPPGKTYRRDRSTGTLVAERP